MTKQKARNHGAWNLQVIFDMKKSYVFSKFGKFGYDRRLYVTVTWVPAREKSEVGKKRYYFFFGADK